MTDARDALTIAREALEAIAQCEATEPWRITAKWARDEAKRALAALSASGSGNAKPPVVYCYKHGGTDICATCDCGRYSRPPAAPAGEAGVRQADLQELREAVDNIRFDDDAVAVCTVRRSLLIRVIRAVRDRAALPPAKGGDRE